MPSKDYDRYAPIPAWTAPMTSDMTLPSGQVVLVRKVQMEDVVELGLLEAMDAFKDIVGKGQVAAKAAKKTTKKAQAEAEEKSNETLGLGLMKDKDKFKTMLKMADRVTVAVVLKPEIKFPPAGLDGKALPMPDREPGLYVDQVPFADKIHVFSSIFDGMENLDSFRGESDSGVDSVPAVTGVSLPSVGNDATGTGS